MTDGGVPALTFLGATGTVTGSRFLVEAGGARLLVDCGLFQGPKALRARNWDDFPINVQSIDAVVVTHAHVDHIGYLPRLHRAGFSGPVLCTPATAELAAVVLPDSGHLQEEEARFANRVGSSRHDPALPLYTEADARAALPLLRTVDFDEPTMVGGIGVTLAPAGHILGSATVRLDLPPDGRSVLFSGDLGRSGHPLLVPPRPPGRADVIVMESTYGGRHHADADGAAVLGRAITRTAERGGSVLIPAFAVDRTEVVLMALRDLMATGRAPRLPVHVDSPMALRALDVYRRSIHAGAVDVRPELQDGTDLFDTGDLHEVHDVEGSKALADMAYPAIIVSASGMATGGRVLHHLARMLPDRRNTVLLVGYQAEGTRGRKLLDGERQLKMFGSYVRVAADVVDLPVFSVHADHDGLLGWLASAERAPDVVYLVHGEPDASRALEDAASCELGLLAVRPSDGERVRLG